MVRDRVVSAMSNCVRLGFGRKTDDLGVKTGIKRKEATDLHNSEEPILLAGDPC